MTPTIEELIEAYLDGELEPEQTRDLEMALVRPEAAAALSRALALREMLRVAPPEFPPAGLVDRINVAISEQLAGEADPDVPEGQRRRRFPRVRAALAGASWSLRWPSLSVATGGAGRSALDGLSTMRNALGPLASRGAAGSTPSKAQPRSEKQAKKEAKQAKKAKKEAKKAKKAKKKAKKEAKKAKQAKQAKRPKSRGAGLLGRLLRRK